MFDGDSLLLSVVFGLIGSAYLMYGKKQQNLLAICVGLALVVFPYFVSNFVAELGIGIALSVLPFWIG